MPTHNERDHIGGGKTLSNIAKTTVRWLLVETHVPFGEVSCGKATSTLKKLFVGPSFYGKTYLTKRKLENNR